MVNIGCVSYLNARPLTDGLESEPSLRVVSDVPSRLLGRLLAGEVAIALCPIVDYQTAPAELCIVPVGAIGSEGRTLTVRLFAERPLSEVSRVAVDGDSRTSVALLQVVLRDLYGAQPQLEPLPAGPPPQRLPPGIDAILLIGDKVVTAAPDLPYQLDLGEAWHLLTGLPFVFAAWLAPASSELGDLPELLRRRRDRNRHRARELATAHAGAAGWPVALAEHYLGSVLRYDIGQRELKAITTFWSKCQEAGLIGELRPLRLYPVAVIDEGRDAGSQATAASIRARGND
jgi:chorismate dehydratase